MNILEKLAEHARERTEEAKRRIPAAEMRRRAEAMYRMEHSVRALQEENAAPGSEIPSFEKAPGSEIPPFEAALRKPGLSFICECKKASPSKGLIAPEFQYLEIAKEYEAAGADCISVLTEPKWFLGSDIYLKEIAAAVRIPCLRKDFTVDPYMIWEAKTLGAGAVLLIVSLLEEERLREFLQISEELGLSALTEVHDEAEAETAVRAGARIIGVNNRNLKDFTVDTENSRRLREMVPEDVLFVSESGVKNAEDVAALRAAGADAVLIGEALMKAPDKKQKLRELRGTG